MLDLKEIQKRLKDRNLSHVARECDLTYKTIWKVANIAYEDRSRISTQTMLIISDYLERHQ